MPASGPPDDATLRARVAQWRPDLEERAARLWPEATARTLVDRLVRIACDAFGSRPPPLRALDEARLAEPDWFQRPETLGYAAYADRFAGTLAGVAERASYLQDLGVTYLHLMPLLQPRPAPNDGGYAVTDYRAVRRDLGDLDDLRTLTATLRAHGISLCLDLVLNHVAKEHPWAVAARAGDPVHRAYFHVFDDRGLPDQFERSLPEVFPAFAPGNFSGTTPWAGGVWTTFNSYQWDLDWSNPDVVCEFAEIICHLANQGVEVFRLDAIAFLWKRMGTSCQNQPEVHELTRLLRTVVRIACPAVVFKAEAIVGPADLPAYLGVGEHAGRVSDLAYHNSLMVQVWSMLAARDVRLATCALQRLPRPPSTTSWITYLRCHDDIGWAIDDGDAAAVGRTGTRTASSSPTGTPARFPGSWARGLVFQANPETGDRRISGSLASLAGLECGDPGAVPRILLAHAIVLAYGGLPVLWMGDEVALLNDPHWADEPAHASDNRWVHRPRMPWEDFDRLSPEATEVHDSLAALLRVRRSLPHLHAAVPTEIWDPRDPGVLLLVRRHPSGPMLCAFNVTDGERPVTDDVLHWLGLHTPGLTDALTGSRPSLRDGVPVVAAPTAAPGCTTVASALRARLEGHLGQEDSLTAVSTRRVR